MSETPKLVKLEQYLVNPICYNPMRNYGVWNFQRMWRNNLLNNPSKQQMLSEKSSRLLVTEHHSTLPSKFTITRQKPQE